MCNVNSNKFANYIRREMPNRNSRTRRNRNKRGGGQGAGWTPGGPLLPGVQSHAQVNQTYDACVSAPRFGQIAYSNTGGLPGMSGGAYTNNLNSTIAGFSQIDKIPCAPNYVNPQNAVGTHQTFVYPQVEGITGSQKGGTPQTGGVGLQAAQDMGVYEAPTARYSQAASLWTDSVGAPVLLNQPLDARMWSKACTATAGGARRRSSRNRRNRSNRKTNRKNRSNRRSSRNRSNRRN